MAKKRKNLNSRRTRKTKVSALDIFDEFEDESENEFVDVESKLSEDEISKIRKSYEESERKYLGIGDKRSILDLKVDTSSGSLNESIQDLKSTPTQTIPNFKTKASRKTEDECAINNSSQTVVTNRSCESEEQESNGSQFNKKYARKLSSKNGESSNQNGSQTVVENLSKDQKIVPQKGSHFEQINGNTNRVGPYNEESPDIDNAPKRESNSSQYSSDPSPIVNKKGINSNSSQSVVNNLESKTDVRESNGSHTLDGNLSPAQRETVVDQQSNGSHSVVETSPYESQTVVNSKVNGSLYSSRDGSLNGSQNDGEWKYSRLSGLTKKIVDYVNIELERTMQNETRPIRNDELCAYCKTTNKTLKSTIRRAVKDKKVLIITESLDGKAGFRRFALPEQIRKDISVLNHIKRESIRESYGESIRESKPSSSSNNTNQKLKNTTTPLTQEWLEIQTPESVKEVSFGRRQVTQLFNKGNLSAQEVQESLFHFAHDLENGLVNPKFGGPLNMLMGILINGNSYISEGYVSGIKEQYEKQNKLREEYNKYKKLEAERLMIEKFEQYFSTLTQEDINKIAPPNEYLKEGSEIQKLCVREKYENGETSL